MARKRLRKLLLLSTALMMQGWMSASGEAAAGFPASPHPPEGAPNVLVIMTDDVGFAASTTFGGEIPTPTLDALAANGLQYSNFFTTALCSPTRAALLTGRNHHAVGFGTVAELAVGEPGYTSLIPKSAATVAQILSGSGYDTAMFGKNHNVPTWQSGSLGPFAQWASGLGFNYFYGFHGGLTDQFHPSLIENTRMIDPPAAGDGHESGYILDKDLADHAIVWLKSQHSQHPRTPFFLYYAPGTAHAPIQAPVEWIERFKGKFDAGWDAYREETLARQKRLGIVPAITRLAPLPDGIRSWAQLSPEEQRVASRYMETYAAALSYCDEQIGRVIAELKRSGQLDNTLVVFIEGDNGASGEGGELGTFDYETRVNGGATKAQEVAYSLAHLNEIGGPNSYPVGPVGWAAAMNTPFPYYKIIASRLGGTRNGMVVSWPARLRQHGTRDQFVHVTDVTPTILEAAGVKPPGSINGASQQPFDGVSFAYSFTQPSAPSRHPVQYFEIFGNAAIYKEGWMLAERVRTDPRFEAAIPDPNAPWQLYDLTKDFSQTQDIASDHPRKVAELQTLWHKEAVRNHVLPLVSNNLLAMLPGAKPAPLSEPGSYTFYPSADRYPAGVFPAINNRSHWSIDADLDVPAEGAEGILVTQGGRASGWALVLLKSAPTFLYRPDDHEDSLFRLSAGSALAPGRHRIFLSFTADGPGFGRGGVFSMKIDGEESANAHIDRTVPFKFAEEDATVGWHVGTAISDDYRSPFTFTGTLNAVTIALGPAEPIQIPQQAKGGTR